MKKENLNFLKIFINIVLLFGLSRADNYTGYKVGGREGLSSEEVLKTFFNNFPWSRDPKINEIDLIKKKEYNKGEHLFLN